MHPQTGHAMPRVFQINRQTLMDVFALFLNCNGMESWSGGMHVTISDFNGSVSTDYKTTGEIKRWIHTRTEKSVLQPLSFHTHLKIHLERISYTTGTRKNFTQSSIFMLKMLYHSCFLNLDFMIWGFTRMKNGTPALLLVPHNACNGVVLVRSSNKDCSHCSGNWRRSLIALLQK